MVAALVQYDPHYLEIESNLDRMEALLDGVDADLIVLPELFASGYFFKSTDDVRSVAEIVPAGATLNRLQHWSKGSGATIVAGLPEKGDKGALFNSAVVVTPRGVLHTYRKTHLFGDEKLHFKSGDTGFQAVTVTDRNGKAYRLGVMICFDWYFPEAARALALGGADVIAHPSNLVLPDCPRSMPTRALENHVFTITANRIGTEKNGDKTLTYIGQSVMCDPKGHTLASASVDNEEVLTVTFDPLEARNRQITDQNHLFDDRKPEHYEILLD